MKRPLWVTIDQLVILITQKWQVSIQQKSAAWNFIKKRLWHGCFPKYLQNFHRATFLRNTCEQLFLAQFHQIIFGIIAASHAYFD